MFNAFIIIPYVDLGLYNRKIIALMLKIPYLLSSIQVLRDMFIIFCYLSLRKPHDKELCCVKKFFFL